MKKEHRCRRCGKLLAIQRDGKLQILCVHRGKETGGMKCGTMNEIPLSLTCDNCNNINNMVKK